MTILNKLNLKNIALKTELLSGLTVALALVPEAIAFAIIAGVEPLVGLYAAFIVAFITSAFGGRPGMISGATGALAVVMVSLVSSHGVDYLFGAIVVMGILQVLFGIFKFGKFIRIVPHPVIFGFVNGLAIVIFMAQFSQFKTLNESNVLVWLSGSALYTMLGLVLLTMAIIYFLPKFTKMIPSSLAAILVVSALVIFLDIDTKTVGQIASIKGGLPVFNIPNIPINFESLKVILPYALIFAGIGLTESLLTLTLIDEITETKGKSNQECVAQGASNILAGLFGGMGGCAMIGQSIINVSSGGRSRLSGLMAACSLLAFILFASSLIEQIPMAALVGVMFMVAIGTFEWTSFNILNKIPKSDAFVMISVTVLTLIFDLAIAVLAGVILSALVFAWDNATRIRAKKKTDKDGTKHYEIMGPLFFASTAAFVELFDSHNDPDNIIIDFKDSRIVDHSGLDAVEKITKKYKKLNKTITLRHTTKDCRKLLKKAGAMIEINLCDDPKYFIATDDA